MKHVKIKSKYPDLYVHIKNILDMRAIEYYQKNSDKPIHLCGYEKENDIKKMMKEYGIKNIKIQTEMPDFEKI